MSSWAVKYLGPTLLTIEGLKPTDEVIAGKKALGIYFSAHWVSINNLTYHHT